jgi:hypothetical protein
MAIVTSTLTMAGRGSVAGPYNAIQLNGKFGDHGLKAMAIEYFHQNERIIDSDFKLLYHNLDFSAVSIQCLP